jgi:hypothetical protein
MVNLTELILIYVIFPLSFILFISVVKLYLKKQLSFGKVAIAGTVTGFSISLIIIGIQIIAGLEFDEFFFIFSVISLSISGFGWFVFLYASNIAIISL